MPVALVMSSLSQTSSPGARLVSTDGRELPLTGTSLSATAGAGVARTLVTQTFTNPYAEALAVTYSLPLPSDGAVSGFAFVIGGQRIEGDVRRRADARADFERAILEGRSAALLEQERSSLFTQEIGNIPPGATVVAEVSVDQPLRWLDEGAWEWRFPTVVAPRYMGAPGQVPDAVRVSQDVSDSPLRSRFTLACSIDDELANGRMPESPSHAMTITAEPRGRAVYRAHGAGEQGRSAKGAEGPVTLRIDEGARLDRDVVVRWMVAAPRVGLSLQVGRPDGQSRQATHAFGLLTIVPPRADARRASVARDLILLFDTSGSMSGEPLLQAKRVAIAVIDTLGPNDRLEMVEFSSSTRRWQSHPVGMADTAKAEAIAWVRRLSASGGTDMVEGILEALRTARAAAQRQVIVMTDGQIGFETTVLSAICARLPAASRLHVVGVGSAVNRSLTTPAARAGRGVEVIIGLGEDPERAAQRLVARTSSPLVVDVQVSGSAVVDHAPARLPDLYAGSPAMLGLRLSPGGGEIVVRGRTAQGTWEQRLEFGPIGCGDGNMAVPALFGREAIEDLELSLSAGENRNKIDAEIERLGLDFKLASRLTSWIAVTRHVTVDTRDGLRRERQPHELPHGMSAEGLGLRGAMGEELGDMGEGLALTGAGVVTAPLGDALEMLPPAAPLAAPMPAARVSSPEKMRAQVSGGELLAERAKKASGFGPLLLVVPLALAIAYWFVRSFWVASLISMGVFAVVLVLRAIFRRLAR